MQHEDDENRLLPTVGAPTRMCAFVILEDVVSEARLVPIPSWFPSCLQGLCEGRFAPFSERAGLWAKGVSVESGAWRHNIDSIPGKPGHGTPLGRVLSRYFE